MRNLASVGTMGFLSLSMTAPCLGTPCDLDPPCIHLYSPEDGIPASPCVVVEDTTGNSATGLDIIDGVLHMRSEGGITCSPQGLLVNSTQAPSDFLWSDGAFIELTARITEGSFAMGCGGGFRGAFHVAASDSSGRFISLQIWPSALVFTTFADVSGGPQFLKMAFDASSEFHDYRFFAVGNQAHLYIDGVFQGAVQLTPTLSDPPFSWLWLASGYAGPIVDAEVKRWNMRFAGLGDIAPINGDGQVSVCDLNVVLAEWGQTHAPFSGGDVTGDGHVNVDDLNIILAAFGTGCAV